MYLGLRQGEILGLLSKILGDPTLLEVGAPQSMAGKAGSLLGSLWRRGAVASKAQGSDGSFGDLWMEFLMKEAGGSRKPVPTNDEGNARIDGSGESETPAALNTATTIAVEGVPIGVKSTSQASADTHASTTESVAP